MYTQTLCILLLAICMVSRVDSSGHICIDVSSCGISCLNGYAQDENGCDLCQCVDDEVVICAILDCEEQPEDCTPVTDVDGCPTCDCVQVCEPMNCGIVPVQCEYGFEKDEFGCETCQCLPPPNCPGDPFPVPCGSSCGPATCEQRLTAIYPFCLGCVSSCQCPDNTFLDTNGKCVSPDDCGCVDSNNDYYRKWSVSFAYVNGKRSICICVPGNRLSCGKRLGGYYGKGK